MNVVLLGVILLSGSPFQVAGSEKNVSLLVWSVRARGMYMSCPFLSSMPGFLCALVIQVLWSVYGAYLWYMECMSTE